MKIEQASDDFLDVRLGNSDLYPFSLPVGTVINYSCMVYSPYVKLRVACKQKDGEFKNVDVGNVNEWVYAELTITINKNPFWIGFNQKINLIAYVDCISLSIQ